jgi:hypothetical protein
MKRLSAGTACDYGQAALHIVLPIGRPGIEEQRVQAAAIDRIAQELFSSWPRILATDAATPSVPLRAAC